MESQGVLSRKTRWLWLQFLEGNGKSTFSTPWESGGQPCGGWSEASGGCLTYLLIVALPGEGAL